MVRLSLYENREKVISKRHYFGFIKLFLFRSVWSEKYKRETSHEKEKINYATLVGKQETFNSLGIRNNQKIELDTLISRLRQQFEDEYYDTENVGQDILKGLEAVKEGN